MSRDTNSVRLKGTVAGAPESRSKANGDRTVTLRLATVDRVQRNGETTEFTNWHRVVCFGNVAEEAGTLAQNDRVSIEGKLQTRKYEVDGKAAYITEVIAFDLDKLASNPTASERPTQPRSSTKPARNSVAANPPGDAGLDGDGPPF
ncbi:single-stranded DNA-binding protein [Cupriavidus oxalaticus]|uniref:Single-stranded DNA-binding protein n=1 Tax=Cupriavidus oxalaticus TaxID=96344 RepID=A0A4P7LJM3_9BURK|nr:single-stranded DNA-binding protein [Cupriavidus oxalaticus]QBY56015.1 single-stranded DNA-binding protein [Cupriavidus oxalaticus]